MAASIVTSIATIPASPASGDTIFFQLANDITSGIPNTIKRADGTTTEVRIRNGYQYMWFNTVWIKQGGDEIVATPLKDAPVLASSEFPDMIMGAVHNDDPDGLIRQFGVSILAQALQAVNGLELTFEDVVLFENPGTTITESFTVPHNLDIRTGSTRHSFDDGYYAFTFIRTEFAWTTPNPDRVVQSENGKKLITKPEWFETQTNVNRTFNLYTGSSSQEYLWKASDTSFYAVDTHSIETTIALKRIIGHKLTLSLKTP